MASRAVVLIAPLVGLTLLASACASGGGAGGGAVPTSASSGGAAPTAAPAAAATPAAASAAGDAGKGKQAYAQSCTACHGPEAKGVPNLGKDLNNNAFIKGQSDAELVAFIKKGRPASDPVNTTKVDMPPKGGNPALSDAQLADIAAFLRTLNK